MSRSRAWRRWKDFVKARRKRELDWSLSYPWGSKKSADPLDFSERVGFYQNLHQYSKNKIHCSCPMCSAKTKNKGGHRVWAPVYNPTMMDKRRADAMTADEFDFFANL